MMEINIPQKYYIDLPDDLIPPETQQLWKYTEIVEEQERQRANECADAVIEAICWNGCFFCPFCCNHVPATAPPYFMLNR